MVSNPKKRVQFSHSVFKINHLSPAPPDNKASMKAQERRYALHIIDVAIIGGVDVTGLHINERHKHAEKLCLSVDKPSRHWQLLPIRCKPLLRLENLLTVLTRPRLSLRNVKKSGRQRVLYRDDDELQYHVPAVGIIILPHISDPWMMSFSRSQNRKYFFNTLTRESRFDFVPQAVANFGYSLGNRGLWLWEDDTDILGNESLLENDGRDTTKILHLRNWESVLRQPGK